VPLILVPVIPQTLICVTLLPQINPHDPDLRAPDSRAPGSRDPCACIPCTDPRNPISCDLDSDSLFVRSWYDILASLCCGGHIELYNSNADIDFNSDFLRS
jgi:hypothetical protein